MTGMTMPELIVSLNRRIIKDGKRIAALEAMGTSESARLSQLLIETRAELAAMSGPVYYVYLAGPLSDMPAQYLANVAAMTAMSRTLIELGLCPINPAADALEGLMSAAPLTLEQYQRRSMDLMRLLAGKPAAVFVIATLHRDGSVSGGVAAEIAEAEKLGIPVVFDIGGLLALRAGA